MIKKILVILFILNFSAFAGGGDEVRNGGGIAENYIMFAYQNLNHSINVCLKSELCAKNPESREILERILVNLPKELAADNIQFSSERKNPGTFMVDGYVRMAVTGSHVGDIIYYNLDMIYLKNEVRMSYGIATQSLIHELGHHLGIVDHDKLELVGVEVRKMLEGDVSEASFLPHLETQGMSGLGLEKKSYVESGSLILLIKDKMIDLTGKFKDVNGKCNVPAEKIRSSAIQFFNIHWKHQGDLFHRSLDNSPNTQILAGNVVAYCLLSRTYYKRVVYSFELNLNVSFNFKFEFKGAELAHPPVFVAEFNGAIF